MALLRGGQPCQATAADPPLIDGPPGTPPAPPCQGAPISPPCAPSFDADERRSLRFKIIAVPADPRFIKLLAKGTISFGGNMPAPRLTLLSYPQYPNSPTASVLTCSVAQMKQILAQQGTYDRVEAALAGPTDPATISWNSGGSMSLGGPLANRISVALGPAPGMPIDLTGLMTLAANLLT